MWRGTLTHGLWRRDGRSRASLAEAADAVGIMPRSMPIPKNLTWVTFDVYGTLIDWETGIYEAFEREAQRDGFSCPIATEVIALFHEVSREIEAGSYELYAEVLRRTALEIGKPHRSGTSNPRARASCPTRSRAGCRSRRPLPSWRRSPRSASSG